MLAHENLMVRGRPKACETTEVPSSFALNGSKGRIAEGEPMNDTVKLISRILMSLVFIVYGYFKFADVSTIVNNPGTKRFMALVAGAMAAPTALGYLIAAIELLGGLAIMVGFKTRYVALGLVIWLIM